MNPQTCLVVRWPAPGRCCPPARTRSPRSVPPRHGPRPADPGSWAPRKTRRVEHLRCWPPYLAGHAPLHVEMKISAAKSCRECSRQKVSKISQCFPIAPLTYETWDVQVVEEGAIPSGLEGLLHILLLQVAQGLLNMLVLVKVFYLGCCHGVTSTSTSPAKTSFHVRCTREVVLPLAKNQSFSCGLHSLFLLACERRQGCLSNFFMFWFHVCWQTLCALRVQARSIHSQKESRQFFLESTLVPRRPFSSNYINIH